MWLRLARASLLRTSSCVTLLCTSSRSLCSLIVRIALGHKKSPDELDYFYGGGGEIRTPAADFSTLTI